MNKILIGIVAVAVIGGGVYFLTSGGMPAQDAMDAQDGASEAALDVAPTGVRSLKSVMAAGGAHVCTFTSEDPNAKNSGTVYISGDSIRGEFESDVKGVGKVKSSMIQNAGFMYTWSDAMPQGIKMAIPAGGAQSDSNATASGQMNFDAGVEMAYDCKSWSPDNASFTPPAGVEFMDMSQMGKMPMMPR
jgi:hypothetical protein